MAGRHRGRPISCPNRICPFQARNKRVSRSANGIRPTNVHPLANAHPSAKASRLENEGELAGVEVCVANGQGAQNAKQPPPRRGRVAGEASVGGRATRARRLSERPGPG